MNIRIAMLCLSFACSSAAAQEPRDPAGARAAERTAMLETMQRGSDIEGDRVRYQHLPQVVAVERRTLAETPQQAVARLGLSGAQIIETKGKLVLFRFPQGRPALVERYGQSMLYPAVLNPRTKNFGVLTGVQQVKLKNMADAAAIASTHGLETVRAFPHLRTVFYRVKANADITTATSALQADTRVERAYPEIIEHVPAPN